MRNGKDLNVDVSVRAQRAAQRTNGANGRLSEIAQVAEPQSTLLDKLLPHGGMLRMTQEAKGVFIPYPLLGIIVTIAVIAISGLVALEIQVSSLNTTLLLRDADTRAEMLATKEKLAQLEAYIHNDREKLVKIETQLEKRK